LGHLNYKKVLEIASLAFAFLHGRLDEEMYICQPEGYIVQGREEPVDEKPSWAETSTLGLKY